MSATAEDIPLKKRSENPQPTVILTAVPRRRAAPMRHALATNSTFVDWARMVVGSLAAIASAAQPPLVAVIGGRVIDAFLAFILSDQTEPHRATLKHAIIVQTYWLLFLALGAAVASFLYTASWGTVASHVTHTLRLGFLRALLGQEKAWWDQKKMDISSAITADMDAIEEGFKKIPTVFSAIASLIGALAVAFATSWKLTLIMFATVPLMIVSLAVLVGAVPTKLSNKAQENYQRAGGIADEALSGIRTVKAYNAQEVFASKYATELQPVAMLDTLKGAAKGVGLGTYSMLYYFCFALTFYMGTRYYIAGDISGGSIVRVFFSVFFGMLGLSHMATAMAAISTASAALSRIYAVIDRQPACDPYSSDGLTISSSKFKGALSFRNVSFSYQGEERTPVLKSVCMDIPAGSTVGIVGESGSGKSTVASLISRTYDCDAGEILLDSVPLTQLNVRWLRTQIGHVSQSPVLFKGTVPDNVAAGLDREIVKDRKEIQSAVVAACKLADAHDFIMELPGGYNYEINETASTLSGGQTQRLAIARAVIKNPKILVLDEATASLDSNSEAAVTNAISRASVGRTTISIAHRLSTVRKADLIVVLSKGEIVESGTPAALLAASGGHYRKMVHAQTLDGVSSSADSLNSDSSIEHMGAMQGGSSTLKSDDQPKPLGAKDNLESGVASEMPTKKIIGAMASFCSPDLLFIIVGVIFSAANGMFSPISAYFLSKLVQVFQYTGDEITAESHHWSLMFVILAFSRLAIAVIAYSSIGHASGRVTQRLRNTTFRTLLYKRMAFFDDVANGTQTLTSMLANDATSIQGVSGEMLAVFLQASVCVLGGIVWALTLGWKLTLAITALVPFIFVFASLKMKVLQAFEEGNKTAYRATNLIAAEAASKSDTVRILSQEEAINKRYAELLVEPAQTVVRSTVVSAALTGFGDSLTSLMSALAYWYGCHLILNDGYDMQRVLAIILLIIFPGADAGRAIQNAPDYGKAKIAARRLFGLLQATEEKELQGTGADTRQVKIDGSVEFVDVKFAYPQRPGVEVLKGITLKIDPGQTVALVGSSGAGKSTVLQLLQGFYQPISGSIKLSGVPLSNRDLKDVRNNMRVISQDSYVFNLPIAENLALGSTIPGAPLSADQMRKALQDASAEFVETLPDGVNTVAGKNGARLSGGQS
ncbi:Multidrug resistance protein 1 [Geranomyces michiganensis]|nr:Multidrug resistance protein 1 [Geranomyces michiganensis]